MSHRNHECETCEFVCGSSAALKKHVSVEHKGSEMRKGGGKRRKTRSNSESESDKDDDDYDDPDDDPEDDDPDDDPEDGDPDDDDPEDGDPEGDGDDPGSDADDYDVDEEDEYIFIERVNPRQIVIHEAGDFPRKKDRGPRRRLDIYVFQGNSRARKRRVITAIENLGYEMEKRDTYKLTPTHGIGLILDTIQNITDGHHRVSYTR